MNLDLKCLSIRLVTIFLLSHTLFKNSLGDVVILNVRNEEAPDDESLSLCVLKKTVRTNDENQRFNLVNLDSLKYDACSSYSVPFTSSIQYLRISVPFQCQLSTLVNNVQATNPSLVLIGSDGPFNLNVSTINLTLSYLFMPDMFAQKLSNFLTGITNATGEIITDTDKLDFSLVLIWFIALFAILTGALWTRLEFKKNLSSSKLDLLKKRKLMKQNTNFAYEPNFSSSSPAPINNTNHTTSATKNNINDNSSVTAIIVNDDTRKIKLENDKRKDDLDKNLTTISVGYVAIFVLLIFVIAMLLLLYFFYNIMIYFIYVIFGIGATTAFYRIGCLLFDRVQILTCSLPKLNVPYLKNHTIEIRKILLFLVSITVSICWFVFRHESWSWIMQNIMALSLAINALSYYRLGTYKTVTILLSVFFLYDIFMVFVTPQFTKGTSIMEAVAFGGKDASDTNTGTDWSNLQFSENRVDNSNRLPVVIVVPHLLPTKRLCDYYYDYPFSLLGLGDILIPGLSVNYAIIFDLSNLNKIPVYFIVNIFAYLIGLIFAFVGLILMNTAQPALLYLCPFLIISSLITSLVRKEFALYWSGEPIKELANESDDNTNAIIQKTNNNEAGDESSKKNLTNLDSADSAEDEYETKP